MAIDVGRFIRLKATIEATAAASTDGSLAAATEAYNRFRGQIATMVDGPLKEEFEGLFPPDPRMHSSGGMFSRVIRESLDAADARSRLAGLVGWLQGLIESAQTAAQLEANATAYAEAKLRAERGLGFGDPSKS
ncbi:MAG TPA: hypothetical protein VGQ89_08420 [Candidatus Limnocylindrales bacterium]|nr:hypothetical protein [Candidatus Limnocylindrales bacterium]